MVKSRHGADQGKSARAGKPPKKRRGQHELLVPIAIRIEQRQADSLAVLADALDMERSKIIRHGIDMGIVWAEQRLQKIEGK